MLDFRAEIQDSGCVSGLESGPAKKSMTADACSLSGIGLSLSCCVIRRVPFHNTHLSITTRRPRQSGWLGSVSEENLSLPSQARSRFLQGLEQRSPAPVAPRYRFRKFLEDTVIQRKANKSASSTLQSKRTRHRRNAFWN